MKRNSLPARFSLLLCATFLVFISMNRNTVAAPAAKPSPGAKQPSSASGNPFLQESTLPFQFPLFDKIKDEHFQPAIEQGMAEQLKEIEKIASQKEKPTFEN